MWVIVNWYTNNEGDEIFTGDDKPAKKKKSIFRKLLPFLPMVGYALNSVETARIFQNFFFSELPFVFITFSFGTFLYFS